jgi:transcriptional regulator with XRE-family HTH domain
MDKRFKPLSPHDQLRLRLRLMQDIADHPQWTVPQAVRTVRTTLRLTVPDMAKLCRVSAQTLQNVELGKASPTLATVDKLLKPFGLKTTVTALRASNAAPGPHAD